MNYARGGDIDPQEMMVGMQNIAGVPGGREVFFSVLADELRGGKKAPKQVRLFNMGGRTGYQGGGLTNAAEMTRQAGRGDDDVLLHLSPEEFEAIEAMWGKAPINPRTGIPEYGFLSDLWKGVKKVVKKIVKSPVFQFLAPIALNTFFPGAGAALGKALGMGTGQLGAHVGNALIRGGIGAAGGGKEGALSGVVSSLTMPGGAQTAGGETLASAGSQIGGKLGLEGAAAQVAGDAIIGGVGGEIGGGGFAQGAMGNVMNRMMMQPIQETTGDMMKTIFDPQTTGIGGGTIMGEGMSPIPAEAQAPDIFGGVGGGGPEMTGAMSPVPAGSVPTQLTDLPRSTSQPWWQDAGQWIKDNPLAAAAGASFLYSGLGGGGDQYGDRPPDIPSNLLEGIPEYTFDRQRRDIPAGLYYTYGVAGGPSEAEFDFFTGNVAGTPPGDDRGGGPLPGLENRPGGRGGGRGGRGGRRRRPGGGRRALPQYDSDYGGAMPGEYYEPQGSYLPGLEPGAPQYTDDQIAFLNWNLPESSGSPYVRMMIEAQRKARERAGWNMAHGGLAQYARGGYTDMPQTPYHMQMHRGHHHHMATGGYAGRNYPRQGFAGAGYARGAGSGRDDTIEALLSDGEYVMDAETVAMLGDGSNDEGARRLDEMREELRKHKGKNLSRGKFSHDAKRPMQYLKKGGGVGKQQVKRIVKDEMETHVRERPPRGHGVGTRGAGRQRKRYKKGGRVKNPLYEARLARIAAERGEK